VKEGKWSEGLEEGKGREKRGERGKGEVGGIAPWLLGDRRHCIKLIAQSVP